LDQLNFGQVVLVVVWTNKILDWGLDHKEGNLKEKSSKIWPDKGELTEEIFSKIHSLMWREKIVIKRVKKIVIFTFFTLSFNVLFN